MGGISAGYNILNLPHIASALGITPESDVIHKPSQRQGVGSTREDIGEGPDDEYQGFLAFGVSAELSIVSTSVLDNDIAQGCRTIFIQGLDADYAVQNRTYDMAGQTPVITTGDLWTRVISARCVAVGPGNRRMPNVGVITVNSLAPGDPLMAYISAGVGVSLGSNFTMPEEHVGVVYNLWASTTGNISEARLYGSAVVDDVAAGAEFPFILVAAFSADGAPIPLPMAFYVPARTDLIMSAASTTGNSDVFGGYTIYLATKPSLGKDTGGNPIFGSAVTPPVSLP